MDEFFKTKIEQVKRNHENTERAFNTIPELKGKDLFEFLKENSESYLVNRKIIILELEEGEQLENEVLRVGKDTFMELDIDDLIYIENSSQYIYQVVERIKQDLSLRLNIIGMANWEGNI